MLELNLSACLMRKKRKMMNLWWIAGEIQIHFTTRFLEKIYRYDSEHVHKALNIVFFCLHLLSTCHLHQIIFDLERSTLS